MGLWDRLHHKKAHHSGRVDEIVAFDGHRTVVDSTHCDKRNKHDYKRGIVPEPGNYTHGRRTNGVAGFHPHPPPAPFVTGVVGPHLVPPPPPVVVGPVRAHHLPLAPAVVFGPMVPPERIHGPVVHHSSPHVVGPVRPPHPLPHPVEPVSAVRTVVASAWRTVDSSPVRTIDRGPTVTVDTHEDTMTCKTQSVRFSR